VKSKNNMSQISLFTPAIDHKERALAAMRHLALEEALKALRASKQIDPSLADLDMLIQAAEFLHHLGVNPKTRVPGLASAWQHLTEARSTMSRAQHSVLESLICQHVLELLPPDYCDYAAPESRTLHIGYCYLVLSHPEAAHKKLLDYLTSRPSDFHPALWGYFGDACHLLKRHDESNSGYVRALFMDPQRVDIAMLKSPELRQIYEDLASRRGDEVARALLPIESWLRGVLHIPRNNTYLAKFIQQQRFDHSSELLLYPAQRYHQFALCLYIDQSGLHGDIDFDARTEMQRLDAELFRRYLHNLDGVPNPVKDFRKK
jgi:tetratricopeptide (TPR) repeat protein